MIRIRQLTKRYGRARAVDGVDLEVARGQAIALWGPNGAGKTTVLRCVLGVAPFRGEITVGDCDVRRQGRQARAQIGFVPQHLAFHEALTVRETVAFYAALRRVEIAPSLPRLERLGVANLAERAVGELSGGMRQRLGLGIALLGDPPVLLLDEPTASLDLRARDDYWRLVAELKSAGKTLLFSTHHLDEMTAVADGVVVLDAGRVTARCSPDELAARLGLMVELRLLLDRARVDEAVAALRRNGYAAAPNGHGVRVIAPAHEKAGPLAALSAAGVGVTDFQVCGDPAPVDEPEADR